MLRNRSTQSWKGRRGHVVGDHVFQAISQCWSQEQQHQQSEDESCAGPQEREGWERRTQKQKPAPNRKGETPCQRLCQLEDAGSRGNGHRWSRQGHLDNVGRPWQDLPTLGFSSKQRDPSSQTILDGRSSRSPPGKGAQPACPACVRMLVQKRLKVREE